MTFMQLTNLEDALPILLNVDRIISIRVIDNTQCEVLVSDGTVFNVAHSMEEIINRIDPFNR
jgi:uncharacterized protein YlzI (FlbEa/FlbD family)